MSLHTLYEILYLFEFVFFGIIFLFLLLPGLFDGFGIKHIFGDFIVILGFISAMICVFTYFKWANPNHGGLGYLKLSIPTAFNILICIYIRINLKHVQDSSDK